VAFDPFLYLAFGLGILAGWVVRPQTPWVGRATLVSVVLLVGLLGASLNAVPGEALVLEIPAALAFTLLILALTLGTCFALVRLRPARTRAADVRERRERFPLSVALLAALVGGYVLGHSVALPTSIGIQWALYALLALVGFGLKLQTKGLGEVWVPLTAAVVGAAVGGGLFALSTGVPIGVSLSSSLAFGFYSLAGPLVAARAGAVFGLLAFLTNFLREDLTMLLSPLIGRRVRGEGLIAMGGATAMDTTLYFVTRYGDPEAGSLAIASGFVLTVVASLVVPAGLTLPV
jgi:uncharacterized membrane protein YbjE (DUF340 family)